MNLLNLKRIIKSFAYAFRGFIYTLKHEQNFRVGIFISLVVIFFMIYFKIRAWEAIILILLITFGLTLELINTAFEKMVDILKPRIHSYVRVIKDIMATTVLIVFIGGLIVALLIFIPYFFG